MYSAATGLAPLVFVYLLVFFCFSISPCYRIMWVKATCGSYHTAAVTDKGELYTWGGGMYGKVRFPTLRQSMRGGYSERGGWAGGIMTYLVADTHYVFRKGTGCMQQHCCVYSSSILWS